MGKQQPNQTSEQIASETELQQLTEKLAVMEANWKRALADYQNLQKRTSQQQQLYAEVACISLIEKLLPVIDHLELASVHLNDPGLNMVVKQFSDALKTEGIEEIISLNLPFDPTVMEATENIPGPKDSVVEVVSKGYRINNRIIRAAKVKVGNGE